MMNPNRRLRTLTLTLLALSLPCACGGKAAKFDVRASGERFIDLLAKGSFPTAAKSFDKNMRSRVSPSALKEIWQALTTQAGPFKRRAGSRIEQTQEYDVARVICKFERGELEARVVFRDKLIGGLWFVPIDGYKPPPYANENAFVERDVFVGTGRWRLPGTLTVPVGEGPHPAVALVHGSGPADRDEAIGPNKPFRDLAWGLASRGIAVLRYDKRTKVYAAKLAPLMDRITVKEETVGDAVAAVSLLRKTKGIDAKRIFVLGHSLGGTLIPRVGASDPNITGFIVMAGCARPLEDVILDQFSYIYSLDGHVSRREAAQLRTLKRRVARVKSRSLSVRTRRGSLPLDIPAGYWLDLRGYSPAAAAKRLKRPMLIMQGARDYQVTEKDFQLWKKALSSRRDVTFKMYANLNHLFMEGDGKSVPVDYAFPGHVAEPAVNDIAEWIKAQ